MTSKPPLALEYIRAVCDDRTLTSTEKLFAMTMARHAGHDGTNAHPGQKLLGEETVTSERTARRTLDSLASKGWLVQTSSGRGNNHYASVYRLAIPQGEAECTPDEPTGQTEQANRPDETGQPATHGLTNQFVEITKEIPVRSDVTVGASLSDQELTGPPGVEAEGWAPENPQTILGDLARLFNRIVPGWEDKPRFDPRFLKEGRLGVLAGVFNRHRFDLVDVIDGLFTDGDDDRAEHNIDQIEDPARFLTRLLNGNLDKLITYGERGRYVNVEKETEAAP